MQKSLIILLTILASITQGISQDLQIPKSLKVNEAQFSLNNVERNGFAIMVNGDSKTILKSFESFLEDAYKLETKYKSHQLIGEELMNTAISDKHVGLYSYVNESGAGNELRFFLNFGTDIYVNSGAYPAESEKAKEILKAFVKQFYSTKINEEIAETNDDLKDDLKDLSKLKGSIQDELKDKAKAEKKIAKSEEKIAKALEEIRELEAEVAQHDLDVANKQTEITEYDKKVAELSDEQSTLNSKISVDQTKLDELKKKLAIVNGYQ